jgi:hypothetical protein
MGRPSNDQLATHLANGRAFIEDICDNNFGAALAKISLVELIQNEKARNLLREAQEAIGRNDLQEAFTKSATALAYGSTDAGPSLDPPLLGNIRLQNVTSIGNREFDKCLYPVITKIDDVLREMSNRLELTISLVSLGIDLLSYNRFKNLTPPVVITYSGDAHTVWRRTPSNRAEDARWCVDFVTDFMWRVEGR